MPKYKIWLLATLLCAVLLQNANAAARQEIPSALLPVEARNAENSGEEDIISTSYVLPNQIFNDGKPYYAGKDSISGQIDFSAKKPAGIEPEFNEVVDPKEKIVLTSNSPNIHDYLNLPVKYSSSKFVYPLVSSSYANLKYQGSNKNFITNKKPTSVVAPVTTAPKYNSEYYTVPTTKLMAVPPTAPGLSSTSTSTSTTTTTTTTTSSSSSTSTKPTIKPVTTTSTSSIKTTTTTTALPPSSSNVPKYTTTSKRPTSVTTTTSAPPRTSTTRKKFVPTKKYIPTTSTTSSSSTPSTPMRFPDARPINTTALPRTTPTTTAATFTTRHPTPSASIFPSEGTTTMKIFTSSSTSQPVVFTEDPTAPPAFSPLPGSTRIPNLDPADVYHTIDQKNTVQQQQQEQKPKPPMTLADIFNSLAEEESAVANNLQQNQGFDAQGNLIEPIAPSKPSPFATQGLGPQRPMANAPFPTTLMPNTRPQNGPQQQKPNTQSSQQMQFTNEQVISGSQETYGNEYVSYQVQQPNVMQYRPAPGAINNVVISPGQHSASFVLGSQQQVGANAFGNVQKEPLFAKDTPVQYGTVINEDIKNIKRPAPGPTTMGNFPATPAAPPSPYQQMPQLGNSNFHQNGNFGLGSTAPESISNMPQRPLPSNGLYGVFQGPPPEAPTPYQQLPLIGSMRPSKPSKQSPQQQPSLPKPEISQQPHSNYQITLPTAAPQISIPPVPAQQEQETQPSNQQQQQQKQQQSQLNDLHSQDTKELLVSTNIRFPANEEESVEIPSAPVAPGPPAGPQVNGHAQPLSLQQLQISNPVVFPKTKENEALPNDVQIQQHQVLTMNQHKQKLNFPQQTEQQLAPSQNMEPPPRFPPALPQQVGAAPPNHGNRPIGPPQSPQFNGGFNEYTRKPIPGITRPNADRNLPNILPQFRPNAKLSSGHPQNFNQEPGNIRIPGQPQLKRPNASPQFAHRRQPLMQQNRYPMNRITDYPPPPPGNDMNRRVYRLPPYGGQGIQYLDRMYPRPRPVQQQGYTVERHAHIASAAGVEPYKTIAPEKMSDFEEEDLVINDPPQPVAPNKERTKIVDEAKLEPVVTLQMLQSQKKAVSLPNDDTGSGEIQVPAEDDGEEEDKPAANSQDGLYLVYPTKGGKKETLNVAESKDTLPAVAHIEAPSGSEYQNTPFSVIRDQPQEPILTVKNKKPQSLQQQTKAQTLKEKFPYPIEKPDPSYSELNLKVHVPGVLIAPRIVNGAYSGTEAPIAIAYTPTEPNPYRRNGPNDNKYSNVNLATSVINEIRTDSQTEEGLSNDFDLRGQNFEKDFMAPFYPSISLGNAANTPANSWNILPSTTDTTVFEKNNINRADVVAEEKKPLDIEVETTTKNFELDSFQPELQGGFKPIYPPGYNHDALDGAEEEAEHMQLHESNNMPLALASRMEAPIAITKKPSNITSTIQPITSASSSTSSSTSTSTSSTTTTTTTVKPQSSTAKPSISSKDADTTKPAANISVLTTLAPVTTPAPTQRKKSTFETSLAALLFGDDEDFDNEARKNANSNTKAKIGPRTMPRMGPRNLKF